MQPEIINNNLQKSNNLPKNHNQAHANTLSLSHNLSFLSQMLPPAVQSSHPKRQ